MNKKDRKELRGIERTLKVFQSDLQRKAEDLENRCINVPAGFRDVVDKLEAESRCCQRASEAIEDVLDALSEALEA